MKIDIDVMMLFKFEFKYVKLNFKAIASMEFSFDIKFYLSCSYGCCLFKKSLKTVQILPSKTENTGFSRVTFLRNYQRKMPLKHKTFRG